MTLVYITISKSVIPVKRDCSVTLYKISAKLYNSLLYMYAKYKTTTIKILAGLLKPDAGSVVINGCDLAEEPYDCKQHTGYISQGNNTCRGGPLAAPYNRTDIQLSDRR